MRATQSLLKHTPLIKFLGKRAVPKNVDHTPHVHPASPSPSLPSTFSSYRQSAQQYGPMAGKGGSGAASSSSSSSTSPPSNAAAEFRKGGLLSGKSGKSLGSVQPKQGEFFDRDELPARFRRAVWDVREIEAVESGGASLW